MREQYNGLEIAVIGISGRFPNSKNIDEFWHNLQNGVNLTSEFANLKASNLKTSNGQVNKLDETNKNETNKNIKVGAVLKDVDQFDASFFGFNPREAETMDPQHRLFLEHAWEALENAGYDSKREERPIGVFAGVGMSTYLLYNLFPNQQLMKSTGFLQTLINADKDYVPTRVSYKLNLKGPSVSVGTACSSSLVAAHLACQSLLSGECDMALGAGVAIKIPQNESTLSPEGIISPDGYCRAFDAQANGTIGGNGIGIVVLKRLEDAIADRDTIYAVIKGSAINNDGAAKVGYTAPSKEGQTKVIRSAQMMAEVKPETITYMETHGTGTPLGDPIEVSAMTQAFRTDTDKKDYCAIGSVKTNIGHLDAAAGIAGLIKTVLALHHQEIPPSLNFDRPNPQIDFENSPFYVNTKLSEWKVNGVPRRAGVSSFGFGGTNVHMVLEEAPSIEASSSVKTPQLLLLSAKTNSALETATANLSNYLKQNPELNLADVAYTLQVGRREFAHRRTVVAADLKDAFEALDIEALQAKDSQRVFTSFTESSNNPSIVFMFPAQGSQYVNMGRKLYQNQPMFKSECDRCLELLKPHLDVDLHSLLFPQPEDDLEKVTQQLKQTAITQPALFVIEYALAKLLMSWGIHPQAAIGHSIGEYVAACIAGVFDLEDGLSAIAIRGKLMQEQPPGTMLAVNLSASEVEPFLTENLSLAASNSPSLSVISGEVEAVEQLEHRLTESRVDYRRLHTSHAFHSPMMDPIIAPFIEHLKHFKLNPPQIPFISNVTGTWITAEDAIDPNYWGRHIRQGVQFSPGISELLNNSQAIFLEVGPGRTLTTLTKQQASGRVVISSLPHPKDKQSDEEFLLNTLGRLWLNGVWVDWTDFYGEQKRDRIPLPTYPFEHQRYWIDPPELEESNTKFQNKSIKKSDIADWFYLPSWKRSVLPSKKITDEKHCWLIFVDEYGLGSGMTNKLEQNGHTVIQVKIGEEFSQVRDKVYTINPKQSKDYQTLLDEVLQLERTPIIAHLWTVTRDNSLETSQDVGFYSLLYLAQAIGTKNLTSPLHIGVVGSNIQDVTGEETICPEKATVLGPCKVIPQEYANLSCCNIDVVIPGSGFLEGNPLIDRIINEIARESEDSIVAYRGNHRWLPSYEAVRLEKDNSEKDNLERDNLEKNSNKTPLRQKGVYLITGGMGGIGLAIAEYLAETVQAKLVLVSRSSLPPKDEWEQWLVKHDIQDVTSVKIRKVRALESLGADVLVLSADVTNSAQMQKVADETQEVFGQINGIFHTAGIPGGGIIQLKTPEMAANIIAPKLQGTLVLEQTFALKDKLLDLFVLFSSHSSIIGGAGQVDYCAANAFLDAFAQYQASQTDCLITTINWDNWQEIGMGVNITGIPDVVKQQRLETLKTGITPAEGLDALSRILQSGVNRAIVSARDWETVLEEKHDLIIPSQEKELNSSTESTSTKPTSQSGHDQPLKDTVYVAPRDEIEKQIATVWEEQLGIKLVGINDNFFELGGHSLLAVRVIGQLREMFDIELSLRLLLEAPTVAGVAVAIMREVNAKELPQNQEVDDEMERVLAEIENLSLDDVQEQLARESQV